MLNMKIRETFEYEVEDCNDINEVFKIKDYIDCVDGMTCPFWDGEKVGDIYYSNLEIIEE